MTVKQLISVLNHVQGDLDVLMWDTKQADWESIAAVKIISIPEGVVMGLGLEPTA